MMVVHSPTVSPCIISATAADTCSLCPSFDPLRPHATSNTLPLCFGSMFSFCFQTGPLRLKDSNADERPGYEHKSAWSPGLDLVPPQSLS